MPSRRQRKRNSLARALRWTGIGLGAAVVAWGLLLLAVVVVPLPRPQLARATEIYDANGNLASKLFVENRTPVPLGDMPPDLRLAVIAAEDDRFYRHHGIDPVGIARAAVRNLLARRVVEGGSTITQQLARNLYLTLERSFTRKAREIFLTLQLESRYSKDEILELYLNTVYLGGGSYGVEAASQLYFGKSVRDLTLPESALLAGLLPAPEAYNPFRDPDLARSRRNAVLDRMVAVGALTAERAAEARTAPVRLAERRPPTRAAYFVDYVLREIRDRHPGLEQDLLRGGYRIETTMDLGMQEAAEKAVAEHLVAGRPDARGVPQPQIALVAIDPRNGYLRAIVGGRDPAGTANNRAVTAHRQPGSAFKPFLYAAVLENGYTAADRQVCEYVSFPGAEAGKPYVPKDYTERGRRPPYHNRPMSVREAVELSDNVVAVKWAATIGPDRIAEMAARLGIESPLEASLPLALGTSEVTPLEMATAYAPFANMGWRVKPIAIRRILDARGRVIEENRPELREVLDESVAYILTDIMKGVITRGTAANLAGWLDRPAAGKTGTTDRNEDAWFIGYTPDLVTAVWVGEDIPAPLPGYGSTLAGPVWAAFMGAALSGLAARDFPRPPGVIALDVSAADGLLPNPSSPVARELFVAGTEPRTRSPLVRWGGFPPLSPEGGPGPVPASPEGSAAAGPLIGPPAPGSVPAQSPPAPAPVPGAGGP